MKTRLELLQLERRIYYPTDSIEFYDTENNKWYNGFGQELKDPDGYDPNIDRFILFNDNND